VLTAMLGTLGIVQRSTAKLSGTEG